VKKRLTADSGLSVRVGESGMDLDGEVVHVVTVLMLWNCLL
jgi:hypothetical protein